MFHTLIARHRADPDRVAIVVEDQTYTYSLLADTIDRCGACLRTLRIRPGSRALLYVPKSFAHWVLTFALEEAGVTTCAVSTDDGVEPGLKRINADLLFTRPMPPLNLQVATHVIDQAWLESLAGYPARPGPQPARSPQDILRIVVTSGTTGVPKKIALTRAMVETRMGDVKAQGFYSRPDLAMSAVFAFSAVAGYNNGLFCFNEGGRLVSGRPWRDMLMDGSINILRLAPANLQALLADLPPDFKPREKLRIAMVGGSLSPQLAERASRLLTTDILVNFGATETTNVAIGLVRDLEQAGSTGFICPWAKVEDVDAQGEPVPTGQVGEIRIWSTSLCNGYLDDPEATAAMFRDGWFWPGDLGQISERGELSIVGRINDLMNLGGAKVLATSIEAVAMKVPGVRDAAAFPGSGEDGIATAWVAYVGDGALNLETLRDKLTRALGLTPVLVETQEIPRNGMGKIQRDLLAGLV